MINKESLYQALKIKGEYLFEFTSMQHWVNKAQSWFKPYGKLHSLLCIDNEGNVLHTGQDFEVAEKKDLYPVKVYKLCRTKDMASTIPNNSSGECSASAKAN